MVSGVFVPTTPPKHQYFFIVLPSTQKYPIMGLTTLKYSVYVMYKTLLIEDDAALAKLSQIALAKRDLEVFHAADGFTALDYLEENKPDLILLDLNIPEIDGWGVLEAAKNRYGISAFKVIVTSARRDMISRARGTLEMVDCYLIKPFTMGELLEAIDEALPDVNPANVPD
ncbi:MAG: response regulator [Anaerolineaceae bacterium]|nr:MAG: response regulator [Anaerolineaceae bacterium]